MVWEFREVRFDQPVSALRPRKGEFRCDVIEGVEDIKGNGGIRGRLVVTNLRLIWLYPEHPKTNLSIGHGTILNIVIKNAESKLRGRSQALFVLTRMATTRFEFVFSHVLPNSPRVFTSVAAIHRSFQTTKMYREVKLRAAIVKDGSLILLPTEKVYEVVQGVWNLASEQGNLGVLTITTVRFAWHASLASNFNVSIPWTEIKTVRVRESRFGLVLVVETEPRSSGYVLGFRVDPLERLDSLVKEISNLQQVHGSDPDFGVRHKVEERGAPLEMVTVEQKEDDIEITGSEQNDLDVLASYYADTGARDRPPVFSDELGLAVETLREGFSIHSLWNLSTTV